MCQSNINQKQTLVIALIGLFLLSSLFFNSINPVSAQMIGKNQIGTPYAIAMLAGEDLQIQSITMVPANPQPNEPTDITIVVRNAGSGAVLDGFYTYLYLDPAQQPPNGTTPHTSRYGHFLGLNSGATFSWSYTDVTFPTAGCGHRIYVWVDRENSINEDNETNNVSFVDFCVGAPDGDSFEGDNTCAEAKPILTDGTTQAHTFTPMGDVDWVKFDAVGGAWYVISGQNVGANASVELELRRSCDQPPSFGGGNPEIEIQPPTDGTYYIRAVNTNNNSATQTDYTLSVRTTADCVGFFEPNDTKDTAKDITPDEAAQTHSFCRANDADWVTFATQAGQTYQITSAPIGSNAAPTLEGFDSARPSEMIQGPTLTFSAATSSRFYVKAVNSRTEFGANTNYSLSVTTQGCSADPHEPDNDRANAHSMIIDSVPEQHNFCPSTDNDWLKFTAQAGQTYTIETTGIGRLSDTQICLRDNLGNQIACDDDSGVQNGSKITWQANAPGEYYVQVNQPVQNTAGPDTLYEVSISSGQCRLDLYEPDDTSQQARVMNLGSAMLHNFCPVADKDWVKVTIPSAGRYTFQTQLQSAGSDTILNLYEENGQSLLASNDDFSAGLASQISYNFTTPGTYYLEISHYNPSRIGRSTTYTLIGLAGIVTPTPTATQSTPTATPTRTPPPNSGIKTLILTNRERFNTLYGASRTNALFSKLVELSNNPYVQGEIIDASANNSVASQYSDWVNHLDKVVKANQVASEIRSMAFNYLDAHSSVNYILIVGDDQIIPFRRIADHTNFPESTYTFVDPTTAIGAALADDYFFTDDYYADRQPTAWQNNEIYIPDLPIGRLIHTPEQIIGLIDTFNTNSELIISKTLISGYDFVKDSATNTCELYSQDIGSANLDCTLIGETWSGTQLRTKQLATVPAYKVQSINGHANHVSQGAPQSPAVTSNDILNGSTDLTGALIYSVGCHAGLDPELPTNNMVSLAQAFAQKGANYLGNTGYGWGSTEGAFFSERVMQDFTQELLRGGSTTIGTALTSAKQRYYQEADGFEVRDEKVLQQVILYGFPMYSIRSGAVLGDDDPFPNASISFNIPTPNPLTPGAIQPQAETTPTPDKAVLSIRIGSGGGEDGLSPSSQLTGYTLIETNQGNYYQLDGHTSTRAEAPLEPRLFTPLSLPDGNHVRGVLFTGGTFEDTLVNPVIASGTNEYAPVSLEPNFSSQGFYPPIPFSLQSAENILGAQDHLSISLGQFNPLTGTQRLYDNVLYDVYFSTSTDQTGPEIRSITGMYDTKSQRAYFKVETNDPSNIARVVVAYAVGNQWASQDLIYNSASYKWLGYVPQIRDSAYFVQVLDGAGNVTVLSRKGGYFHLDEVVLDDDGHRAYLPMIKK